MTTTTIVLITVAFFLVLYDIYIVTSYGIKSTISWILWMAAHKYPILPLAVGILLGHLFWSQTC